MMILVVSIFYGRLGTGNLFLWDLSKQRTKSAMIELGRLQNNSSQIIFVKQGQCQK